jgi:hypothetical protein
VTSYAPGWLSLYVLPVLLPTTRRLCISET